MYGGIGDIWRDYGRRREIDGVNQQGVGVRREIVWLPEQPPALTLARVLSELPSFNRGIARVPAGAPR
jgi:hypothetical protein